MKSKFSDSHYAGYSGRNTLSARRIADLWQKEIGVREARRAGVAAFYENFLLNPKGKYIIKVCDGTACHVRKSIPILESLQKELGLSRKKHTTDDMLFTVETVSCLGACGLAPTMTVNNEVHPSMTPEKALELIAELRGDNV